MFRRERLRPFLEHHVRQTALDWILLILATATVQDAQKAIEQLNGKELSGRVIVVSEGM
jgi:hypothetical protein